MRYFYAEGNFVHRLASQKPIDSCFSKLTVSLFLLNQAATAWLSLVISDSEFLFVIKTDVSSVKKDTSLLPQINGKMF